MKVVLGELTGLPFPAEAEIVLEGYCYPDKRRQEGPFGEWTGFYGSSVREAPVMDVRAIYYRNDPILLGSPPQRPPDEHSRYLAVVRSAQLKDALKRAGVPTSFRCGATKSAVRACSTAFRSSSVIRATRRKLALRRAASAPAPSPGNT
jgi:UbiD family decarboxylase